MRVGLAFFPLIRRLFPSRRNDIWRAWELLFAPTLVSQVWIQMELSLAERKFWPALYCGELVSSRLRRDDGYAQKPTSRARSWWNRTCRYVIILRSLPSVTPLISWLRFEIYLASNPGRRC